MKTEDDSAINIHVRSYNPIRWDFFPFFDDDKLPVRPDTDVAMIC